ncbi:MAG: hypothetical protein WC223_12930 [Bacteroidales bacterium]|jgi:hypothetical protein
MRLNSKYLNPSENIKQSKKKGNFIDKLVCRNNDTMQTPEYNIYPNEAWIEYEYYWKSNAIDMDSLAIDSDKIRVVINFFMFKNGKRCFPSESSSLSSIISFVSNYSSEEIDTYTYDDYAKAAFEVKKQYWNSSICIYPQNRKKYFYFTIAKSVDKVPSKSCMGNSNYSIDEPINIFQKYDFENGTWTMYLWSPKAYHESKAKMPDTNLYKEYTSGLNNSILRNYFAKINDKETLKKTKNKLTGIYTDKDINNGELILYIYRNNEFVKGYGINYGNNGLYGFETADYGWIPVNKNIMKEFICSFKPIICCDNLPFKP